MNIHMAKALINAIANPRGKEAFVFRMRKGITLLDVGCGPYFPDQVAKLRPDIRYIGLDISAYPGLAKPDIIVASEDFAAEIEKMAGLLDAVVSSHNIEHCNEPARVMRAMARSLRPGGRLFLVFPSAQSVNFPSRYGCLNYYDDCTHRNVPPLDDFLAILRQEGLRFEFMARNYHPAFLYIIGLLLEPVSALLKRVIPLGATWAFYGFESMVWARKGLDTS